MNFHLGRYDSRKNAESYAETVRNSRPKAIIEIQPRTVYDVIEIVGVGLT